MIQEGFSFHTTSSTQKLTNNYKEEINIISELNEDTPLVLDTNILLRLYCIPLNRKKQLIKFFQEKKNQLFLSHQVKKEFLRHRLKVMQEFLPWVYQDLYPFLKQPVSLEIKRFLDKPNQKQGGKILKQLKFQEELMQELIQNDEVFELIENCELLPEFTDQEYNFLNTEFSFLSQHEKKIMFPGKGDIGIKQKNQLGDYLIFHEMLKFMKEENKPIVFFTVDTSKGDWLDKQKKPHTHYLEKTLNATNNYLVIVDGTRWLEKKFNTHLDPFPLLSEQKLSANTNILTTNLFVIHSAFGKGVIKSIYDNQGKQMVCVDFEKFGEKHLLKDFCKLQIFSTLSNFTLINQHYGSLFN